MSFPAPCPACWMGNHDKHDAHWNITPGLIGGNSCDCKGDCADLYASIFADEMAEFKAFIAAHKATP